MKKKTFQIDIPEPCNESWDKMTPQEKGRFCGNCEKTIIDYSLQPDRVIAKVLKENNGQICGRFRSDQLQRDIVLEPQFYQNTRWKAFGLMISGLLAAGALKGQEIISNNNSPVIFINDKGITTNNIDTGLILSGRIIDHVTKKGIIGASVLLSNNSPIKLAVKELETTTDIEGYFHIETNGNKKELLDQYQFLIIDFIDYQTKTITLNEEIFDNELSGETINSKSPSDEKQYSFAITLPIIELSEIDQVDKKHPLVKITSVENCIIMGDIIPITIVPQNHNLSLNLESSKNPSSFFSRVVSNLSFKKGKKQPKKEENTPAETMAYAATEPLSQQVSKSKQPQDRELPFLPKIIQKIYPNPFIDKLNIEIKVELAETYDLVLFNELGQEIHRKTVAAISGINQFTLHLNENKLAIGTYFLSILNGKEILQTEIVIRQD